MTDGTDTTESSEAATPITPEEMASPASDESASASPLSRYKLTIAYRGTRYHGWQTQPMMKTYKGTPPPPGHGIPTIQEIVRRVVAGVVNHPIILTGSSRTDAGVHAKGQVAHFETDKSQIPIKGFRRAINARLPGDILIRDVEAVPREFCARKSTLSKRYQYFVWHHEDRPVLFSDMAFHRWQKLDIDAMRQAAAAMVGTQDFASFARPGHGKESTVRTVLACDVSYRSPKLIIGVEGTGFLWNMVRIMAGTLLEVGIGKLSAAAIPQIIAAKNRKSAGGTAPAHGLYLQWIKFKDHLAPPAPDMTEVTTP
jgi:tRNA pseudouridine38-40 synthase